MVIANGFAHEQRGAAFRMAAALCVTVVVSATCLVRDAADPTTVTDRLIVTARADLFVVIWLAVTIGNVALLRFFSADDIAGGGSGTATAHVSRAKTILKNTLEQVVLAAPVQVTLAMLVASSMPLVVTLATLFAVGRLLVWVGYARSAEVRTFGFALTFYPTLAGLVVAVFATVRLPL